LPYLGANFNTAPASSEKGTYSDLSTVSAAEPDTYYLKDHYVGYPCVLVRLKKIRRDALKDLLLMGWRFVSATTKRRPARRPSSHQPPATSHSK